MPIAFKSMELDDEDMADMGIPCSPCATDTAAAKKLLPEFPWGLRITLTQKELKKMGLSCEDMPIGATVHLHALAKVTSVSTEERRDGSTSERVELQIEQLALESEDEENEEADAAPARRRPKLREAYGK